MIDDEDRLCLAHEWGRQRNATIEGKQMMWLVAEVRRLRAEREHFLEQSGLAHDEKDATIASLRAQLATARAEAQTLLDDMETAWGIIANVGHKQGSWETQDPEWREAAIKWRDAHWHPALKRAGLWGATAPAAKPTLRERLAAPGFAEVVATARARLDAEDAKPTPDATCGTCGGHGRIQSIERSTAGVSFFDPCPDCGTMGRR